MIRAMAGMVAALLVMGAAFAAEEGNKSAKVVPLAAAELESLLNRRMDGRLGYRFRQYANMFVAQSYIELGCGVCLTTSVREASDTELQPVYPLSYRPKFRELLDMIALQTSTTWSYDPVGRLIVDRTESPSPASNIAVFEFTADTRPKTFGVDVADGWIARDRGHWMQYIPPESLVGLDIYHQGRYSFDGDSVQAMEQVRDAVALQWAQRVKSEAARSEMKLVNVGAYDALFFSTRTPARGGGEVTWRQWVFAADDCCFFAISTLFPETEARLLPDVEAMLASFRHSQRTTP